MSASGYYMFIIVLFVMLSMCTSNSEASERHELQLTCCSYHFDREIEYNELNYGATYHYNYSRSQSAFVGAYKNSHNVVSVTVGGRFRFDVSQDFKLGIIYGGVTGYEYGTVMPYVMPTLSYKDTIHVYVAPVDRGMVGISFTVARWGDNI